MDAEYTSSKPHRVSVKQRSPPHQLWRDRFKQQCLTRIKESRDSLINSRRLGLMVADNTPIEVVEDEEKIIGRVVAQEWKKFQEQNEKAYLRDMKDVDANVHAIIENELLQETRDSLEDHSYDEILALEEAELNSAIEAYEESQMVQVEQQNHCHLPLTFPVSEIERAACFHCHQTDFQIEASSTGWIDQSITAMCSACGFRVEGQALERIYHVVQKHVCECSGQPLYKFEPSTGLIMLCSLCDMCEVF